MTTCTNHTTCRVTYKGDRCPLCAADDEVERLSDTTTPAIRRITDLLPKCPPGMTKREMVALTGLALHTIENVIRRIRKRRVIAMDRSDYGPGRYWLTSQPAADVENCRSFLPLR